jgi:Ala-tRNA(Pro) deacylase
MLEKVKFEGDHSKAIFAKNLFLNNKKKKEQVYLVIAAHDTKIDMKGLEKHLKSGSGNLRAGDQDVMEALLGATKGAVNLFSILNDKDAKKVHLIMDQRLMNDFEVIAFHPMQNDATTAISNADMKKVIQLSNHEAEVIDFSKLVSEAGAAPAEKKDEGKKPAAKPQGKEAKAQGGAGAAEDSHKLGIEYTR